MKENEKVELYVVTDKVTGNEVMYFKAVNDKDAVRGLALSGYFKTSMIKETKLEKCNFMACTLTEVDIDKVVKELEYKFENEAEKIDGTVDEVKNKIKNRGFDKIFNYVIVY